MDRSETQVFMTGCYRSGTEYITHLVNNSPDIAAEMYATYFMRFSYEQYDPIEEELNYSALVFDTGCRMRVRWDRILDVHGVLDACESEETVSYDLVYDAIMQDIIPDGIDRWAEKLNLEWTSIPDFLEMFDDGKAVLIVRDPRSVLASFKRFTYAPEPRYLGAIFNALGSMQSGLRYREELSDDRFHIIQYEDVVREAESTLTTLFDFLGLPADHDLTSEEGWTDPFGDSWGANTAFGDDDDFDDEAAVNRWKGNLKSWELALCERVTGEVMQEYGYQPSGVTVEEEVYLDRVRSDEQIRSFYERWQSEGKGVEKFPTDPSEPDNWEENAT